MEPGYRSATADDDSYAVDGSADTTTVQGSKRDASSAPDGASSAKRSKRKTAARKGSKNRLPRMVYRSALSVVVISMFLSTGASFILDSASTCHIANTPERIRRSDHSTEHSDLDIRVYVLDGVRCCSSSYLSSTQSQE
ncbi:hypothetical protein E4U27_007249 [Claviceps purpurea]|nr:hypothetical protein E4U27_007249 [Claviceps purpurea]